MAGLLIASFFLGLSLNSWRFGVAALAAYIVTGLFNRLRYVHVLLVLAGFLFVMWNFGGSFIKYLLKAQGAFETGYVLVIGVVVTSILITAFGALLGFKEEPVLAQSESANDAGVGSSDKGRPLHESIEVETDFAFDPYQVLSVDKLAGPDEIHSAYRKQMGLYHPDKVEHLGAELQEVARKRVLDIQRAFEMLSA